MNKPTISYSPLPGASPKAETDALAAVYVYLMQRRDGNAAKVGGDIDIGGGKEDHQLEATTELRGPGLRQQTRTPVNPTYETESRKDKGVRRD